VIIINILATFLILIVVLFVGILVGVLIHKDNYINCLERLDVYKDAFAEVFNKLSVEEQDKILNGIENERKLEEKI